MPSELVLYDVDISQMSSKGASINKHTLIFRRFLARE